MRGATRIVIVAVVLMLATLLAGCAAGVGRDEAGLQAVKAARVLIAAGADVNAVDDIGDSAYLYAGAEGHVEILELTLANGADLAATNRFGGTALIPAAEKGHPEAVRMLIAAGVDVDHVNNLGWTALQEAVVLGEGGPVHLAVVGQLLDAGADPNLGDRDGHTPLRNAEERNHTAIAERIRRAGGRR